MIESFSDVVYFARMPDLLLDQGSKKSSSLSFVLAPCLGKDDCKKIRMMMYIIILCLTIIRHFYITHWLLGILQCLYENLMSNM